MWAPIALNKAGANLNIVDAGGASDRVVALLGEHVDVICNSISSVKDLSLIHIFCASHCDSHVHTGGGSERNGALSDHLFSGDSFYYGL